MALPLIALGFAAARVLGQRALMGRLASTVARRALLAGRASRLSGARVVVKKPLPFLPPVFDPIYDWGPAPNPLPEPSYAAPGEPAGFRNLGEWVEYTLCDTPSPAYSGGYARLTSTNLPNSGGIVTAVEACFVLQAVASGSLDDPWNGLSDNVRSICVGRTRVFSSSIRAQAQIGFTRPNQGPFEKPYYDPNPRPGLSVPLAYAGALPPLYPSRNVSNALRQLAPQLLPIQNYAPHPVSMPYRAIVPARKLYPYMPGAPYFERPLSPAPSPRPSRPSEVPLEEPRSEFPPRAVPLARGHMRRPPIRGREKEVKVRQSAAVLALKAAVGVTTEALEVLDVLYKALPSAKKPRFNGTRYAWKNPPPQVKARAVYDNFSSIDAPKAIMGHLQNQIEDILIGRAARGVRRNQLASDPLRPIGWLSGPAL